MANAAEWIWYNGDYEIMQLNHCLTQRYERGAFIPPFWKMDMYFVNVKFTKRFILREEEELKIIANGKFNVSLCRGGSAECDLIKDFGGTITLPPGEYTLTVSVYNDSGLPALYVDGKTVKTDGTFLVTCNDAEYVSAGFDGLTDPNSPPSFFRFCTEEVHYRVLERTERSVLVDCGAEMVARPAFCGDFRGLAKICYGESLAEATRPDGCELNDCIDLSAGEEVTLAKACRYLYIVCDDARAVSALKVYKEYHPLVCRSEFACSDALLDKIYEVSRDTLALNTREFYLDGIKRDRWVWAGDAYQSYLMSFYSFFDRKTIERTTVALAGKKPVVSFINQIMDYSFLWIIGLWEYYRYIGDMNFLGRMLPMAEEIVKFTMTRCNAESGLVEGKPCDWVFLDWANLDNRGEVSAEQILFWKSLDVVGRLCELLGKDPSGYFACRDRVKRSILSVLWDEERGVFHYSRFEGKINGDIKKHAHIFAILFGFFKDERAVRIGKVLTDKSVEAIVTPYMRFYELSALCSIGEKQYVLDEIRSYWGGMIDEGATSFWELYDPNEKGDEKYAMYGRPFGKSLCHAWGAGPLYLLGRYFVGLEPASPGYASFLLKPSPCDLKTIRCTLPVGESDLRFELDETSLYVYSEARGGKLLLNRREFAEAEGYEGIEDDAYLFTVRAGVPLKIALKRCKPWEGTNETGNRR